MSDLLTEEGLDAYRIVPYHTMGVAEGLRKVAQGGAGVTPVGGPVGASG